MPQEEAIFAGGCFWCTEAVFGQLTGVHSVVSGYIGGHTVDPTYKEVCGGSTGHAEAIRIAFDAEVISYADLLEIFFATHDPTQLNRQGNDIGTQYRSAIFLLSDEQREMAKAGILKAAGDWPAPIVTTIEPFTKFYVAENYHQDYYKRNGNQPYCYFVIRPKMEKFEKAFKDKMKK